MFVNWFKDVIGFYKGIGKGLGRVLGFRLVNRMVRFIFISCEG